MTSEDVKARRAVIAKAAEHGWSTARITKKGYVIMRCGCGQHQTTLHKTPSNPGHFEQKLQWMIRICSEPLP